MYYPNINGIYLTVVFFFFFLMTWDIMLTKWKSYKTIKTEFFTSVWENIFLIYYTSFINIG